MLHKTKGSQSAGGEQKDPLIPSFHVGSKRERAAAEQKPSLSKVGGSEVVGVKEASFPSRCRLSAAQDVTPSSGIQRNTFTP